jgi:hypothetical protein
MGYENAYILIIQYDEYLLIPLLIHYYKMLMLIMLDEVQVHNFDFECKHFF